MRLCKTDNLKIEISVTDAALDGTGMKAKRISVKFGDSEPVDARLSEQLIKAQINDNAFIRHILNFFVKG